MVVQKREISQFVSYLIPLQNLLGGMQQKILHAAHKSDHFM